MHVIIMAGGAGTRFWPLSRLHRPKQFLTIIGARPMIEEAFLRIAPLTDEGKIYIVVHEDHRELTKEIFTGKSARIVAEPMSRNTAPCIGLGLIHIMAEHGDGPVVVLPADHYVGDLKAFQRTIRRAVSLVEQGGIATIGIVPTRPETGYGYIKGVSPLLLLPASERHHIGPTTIPPSTNRITFGFHIDAFIQNDDFFSLFLFFFFHFTPPLMA